MYRHNLDGIPEQLHSLFMSTRICMKGEVAPDLAGYQLSKIAKELYEESTPLREAFMGDWTQLGAGKLPTYTGTMYSALRKPIEDQYDVAKENILSSLPQGGALQSALAENETGRAMGLQGVLQDIFMDQLSKAYGYATGAPQQSISAFGGASQSAQTAAQIKAANEQAMMSGISSGVGGLCCWNFLAAHGKVTEDVKRYRDEHYPKGCSVSKGYKWMSEWFVPLMKVHPRFRRFIDFVIFDPMTKYAEWYYGKNKYGWIFKPIATFATGLWGEWGKKIPQARKYYMFDGQILKDKTGV
jgi:hypothetical protein